MKPGASLYIHCITCYSLMEACYFGQNECVMLVHSAGASWLSEDKSGIVNSTSRSINVSCIIVGMTALHYAVSGGKSETVELLLTQGVPVSDYQHYYYNYRSIQVVFDLFNTLGR